MVSTRRQKSILFWSVNSVGRVVALQAASRRFEPRTDHEESFTANSNHSMKRTVSVVQVHPSPPNSFTVGEVAQLVEQVD